MPPFPFMVFGRRREPGGRPEPSKNCACQQPRPRRSRRRWGSPSCAASSQANGSRPNQMRQPCWRSSIPTVSRPRELRPRTLGRASSCCRRVPRPFAERSLAGTRSRASTRETAAARAHTDWPASPSQALHAGVVRCKSPRSDRKPSVAPSANVPEAAPFRASRCGACARAARSARGVPARSARVVMPNRIHHTLSPRQPSHTGRGERRAVVGANPRRQPVLAKRPFQNSRTKQPLVCSSAWQRSR